MKQMIWKILVRLTALLPVGLRRVLSELLFCAGALVSPARAGLIELLDAEERLGYRLDECAIRFEGGIHPKHRLMDYHRFFLERLGPSDRVLDIGCGTGSVAASLAKTGAQVTAVDIVPEKIAAAQGRYASPNIRFMVADATKEVPNGEHDVVVLSNILEHIKDRQGFLKQVTAVSRPVRWLIRVPAINRHWHVALRQDLGLPYFSDLEHHIEYTIETLTQELTQAGLTITHTQSAWGEIWVEARPDLSE